MAGSSSTTQFTAKLRRPAKPGGNDSWAFVVFPKEVSETLPRRGRTTIDGRINGHSFQATLDPDGQLSHWLRVDQAMLNAAGAEIGDTVALDVAPVQKEPEPEVPADLEEALAASPEARAVWEASTPIARLDWIHWITSAKQEKTRVKRVNDACDMLSSGKKRVCCFDQSGFYSKALSAPKEAE